MGVGRRFSKIEDLIHYYNSTILCHILAYHDDIGDKSGQLSSLSLKCASKKYQGNVGDI